MIKLKVCSGPYIFLLALVSTCSGRWSYK